MENAMTTMRQWQRATRQEQGFKAVDRTVRGGKGALAVACVSGLRGEKLRAAVDALDRADLPALLESRDLSRIARVAIISRLRDVDVLVSVAAGTARPEVRKDALQRLDALCDGKPLSRADLDRLIPCLYEEELIAFAIVLMDAAGYDWCTLCDEAMVGVLSTALHECSCIHETVLLEDAFAQLAYSRPDLVGSMRACSPERFFPRVLSPASSGEGALLVSFAREDNVA